MSEISDHKYVPRPHLLHSPEPTLFCSTAYLSLYDIKKTIPYKVSLDLSTTYSAICLAVLHFHSKCVSELRRRERGITTTGRR